MPASVSGKGAVSARASPLLRFQQIDQLVPFNIIYQHLTVISLFTALLQKLSHHIEGINYYVNASNTTPQSQCTLKQRFWIDP